ncbi:hypothetical protein [Mesomycoplasma molare]|uniref:Lipoprotein n=1 Tax=Mesomycoplasma molare TaxID=171288 RepID=A0ABY5TWV9_9BACT|nr:hypothetical protein [Mesomycoplasma molare]UWD34471.1 hypothetical protein NX772_01410 [Mesomycoplasma molare]
MKLKKLKLKLLGTISSLTLFSLISCQSGEVIAADQENSTEKEVKNTEKESNIVEASYDANFDYSNALVFKDENSQTKFYDLINSRGFTGIQFYETNNFFGLLGIGRDNNDIFITKEGLDSKLIRQITIPSDTRDIKRYRDAEWKEETRTLVFKYKIKGDPTDKDYTQEIIFTKENKKAEIDETLYENILVPASSEWKTLFKNKVDSKGDFYGLQFYPKQNFIGIISGNSKDDNKIFVAKEGTDFKNISRVSEIDKSDKFDSSNKFPTKTLDTIYDSVTGNLTFKYKIKNSVSNKVFSQTINVKLETSSAASESESASGSNDSVSSVSSGESNNMDNSTSMSDDDQNLFENAFKPASDNWKELFHAKLAKLKNGFRGMQYYKRAKFIGLLGGNSKDDNKILVLKDGLNFTQIQTVNNHETNFSDATYSEETKILTIKYKSKSNTERIYTQTFDLN